jgi:hypothetical protein
MCKLCPGTTCNPCSVTIHRDLPLRVFLLADPAKNNNLIVYNYLRFLFTKLPEAKSSEDLERLLPCNISPDDVKIV